MVSFLITLLVVAFFVYIIYEILKMFSIPPHILKIAMLIVGFVILVMVLQHFGYLTNLSLK